MPGLCRASTPWRQSKAWMAAGINTAVAGQKNDRRGAPLGETHERGAPWRPKENPQRRKHASRKARMDRIADPLHSGVAGPGRWYSDALACLLSGHGGRPTVAVAQPQQPTEIIDMPWIFFRRLYQPQPLARIIAFNQTRGRMMRRVLVLSIVSAALTVGAAQAADMPVKAYRAPVAVPAPVFTWTGFYVGANAGGHWSKDELTAPGNSAGLIPAQ